MERDLERSVNALREASGAEEFAPSRDTAKFAQASVNALEALAKEIEALQRQIDRLSLLVVGDPDMGEEPIRVTLKNIKADLGSIKTQVRIGSYVFYGTCIILIVLGATGLLVYASSAN